MEKCPKCGYSNEPFEQMMDRVIKEVSDRHRKELGYGIPDKIKVEKETIKIRRSEWQPEKRQKKQK